MMTTTLILTYLLQIYNSIDTSAVSQPIKASFDEVHCLAQNIYHEARGETVSGQFAVALVTANRAKDSRFPNTICGVIKQSSFSKTNNKKVCAFSWYCDRDKKEKELPLMNKDGTVNNSAVEQFRLASLIAITVLNNKVRDNTQGATHFHNPDFSQPSWISEMKKTITLGNHDFYRMPPASK